MKTAYVADQGLLIILSGPSGVGKNTVITALQKRITNILLSTSATTRLPRAGETDGVNYYFKTHDEFEQMIADDAFIEYAQYNGNYYGTPKGELFNWIEHGNIAMLEIEVQGAARAKQKYPQAIRIFLAPPTMNSIMLRLRGRNTEQESAVQARYIAAYRELAAAYDYDYIVVNDSVENAINELETIIAAEMHKVFRNKSIVDRLVNEK